jgi:hypothetical protein
VIRSMTTVKSSTDLVHLLGKRSAKCVVNVVAQMEVGHRIGIATITAGKDPMTDEEYNAIAKRYYLGEKQFAIENLAEIRPDKISEFLTQADYEGPVLGAGLLLILVDIRLNSDALQELLVDMRLLLSSLSALQSRRRDLPLDSRKELARQLLQARTSILLYARHRIGGVGELGSLDDEILSLASKFYHRSKSLGVSLLAGRDHGE